MLLAMLKVFLGVERGGSLDPRMNRVGGNNVKFLLRREVEVPGVVVNNLDTRVMHHVVVGFSKIFRNDSWDKGLNFANDNSFDVRIGSERSSRDTGSAADDQHRARLGVH